MWISHPRSGSNFAFPFLLGQILPEFSALSFAQLCPGVVLVGCKEGDPQFPPPRVHPRPHLLSLVENDSRFPSWTQPAKYESKAQTSYRKTQSNSLCLSPALTPTSANQPRDIASSMSGSPAALACFRGLLVNALSVISTPQLIGWATCLPPCLQMWALIRSPIRSHLIRYESYSLLGGDSHSSQSCCGGPWVSQGRVKSHSCSSQKIF